MPDPFRARASAPLRVRDRLRGAPDGPVPVLHAGAHAVYVEVGGWCVGVVGPGAAQVPCALRVSDIRTDPDHRRATARHGVPWGWELHVGGRPLSIGRLVGAYVPPLGDGATQSTDPVTVEATPPATVAGFVSAHLSDGRLDAAAAAPAARPRRGAHPARRRRARRLAGDAPRRRVRDPRGRRGRRRRPRPDHPALRDAARLRPPRRGAPPVRRLGAGARHAPPSRPPSGPSTPSAPPPAPASTGRPARPRPAPGGRMKPPSHATTWSCARRTPTRWRCSRSAATSRRCRASSPPRSRWRPRSTSR